MNLSSAAFLPWGKFGSSKIKKKTCSKNVTCSLDSGLPVAFSCFKCAYLNIKTKLVQNDKKLVKLLNALSCRFNIDLVFGLFFSVQAGTKNL